jgi:hypothetical protein
LDDIFINVYRYYAHGVPLTADAFISGGQHRKAVIEELGKYPPFFFAIFIFFCGVLEMTNA